MVRKYIGYCVPIAMVIFVLYLFIPLFTNDVDKELQNYVNEYIKIARNVCDKDYYFNKHYVVKFDDFKNNWAGVCFRLLNSFEVGIDRMYWNLIIDLNKKCLLFHELSHCFFDVEHSPDVNNYMYYQDTYMVSYDTLIKQVEIDVRNNCK